MAQEEGDWSHRIAQQVGARVKHYRAQPPKMTTQKLADRCGQLGMALDRSVIAKLEAGRRMGVTVAEVLILARALRVAPLLLVAPVGDARKVEILPGAEVEPWAAAKWLAGELNEPVSFGSEWDQITDAAPLWREEPPRLDIAVVPWFRRHDELVRRWRVAVEASAARRREADQTDDATLRRALEGESEARQEMAERLRDDIADVREEMLAAGLTPPELPVRLRGLQEGPDDGA